MQIDVCLQMGREDYMADGSNTSASYQLCITDHNIQMQIQIQNTNTNKHNTNTTTIYKSQT